MSIYHIISGDKNISFIANGKQYYVASGSDEYASILDALEWATDDEIVEMVDRSKPLENFLIDSDFAISGGCITYKGEHISNTVVDRIIDFQREGLPWRPLVNFLRKLLENPSFQSATELYDFLDHRSLPVCEDGDFLAYKAVTHDYKDKRTGKIDNSVGSVVRESRRKVNDDRDVGCSSGLHAGTLDYVQGFGSFTEDEFGNPTERSDKCIIVKINPANVVSVPTCSSFQKLRTCEYTVLMDYQGEMDYHLATDEGNEWVDEDDEDEEDYDYVDDTEFFSDCESYNILVGDHIEFNYYGKDRELEVREIDDDSILGVLGGDEVNAGSIRRFHKSGMRNIDIERTY